MVLKSRVGVGCAIDSRTLKPVLRQFRAEQLGEAGAEQRILVHDHHGLGRLAGAVIDRHQIVERRLGDDAETGAEAEGVLQAALDDRVGDADVDDVRQIVARRGLRGGKADRRSVAADDAGHAGRIHLLHFGDAAGGRRLRIAEHGIDLGAAQRLDAAGGVDLLDRQRGAEPALRAGIRQRAGDRVQHAELHRRAGRAQHGRHGDAACRGRCRAQRGGGEKLAAAERDLLVRHGYSPS